MVLNHIGIHNQYNETSVEELTQERTFHNSCFLLTYSIFTYPGNKCHHNLLQNNIHCYNNDRDGKG